MRFCSSLASRIRSVETTRFQPVCGTWTINYACGSTKGNKYESVLVKAMSDGAFQALGKANLRDLTHGFRRAVDAVVKNLNSRARKISTFEEMAQFGTTEANGDREIGELVAGAFEKGWEINDLIIVFDRKALYDELKFVNGMKLEWGILSPYFFTYENKKNCVLHNPLVLIHEMKILNINVIKQAIMSCEAIERPLFIVAEDVENEVLGHFASDFQCAYSRVCVIKAAGFREYRRAIMEDLAILTGSQVLTGGLDMNSTYSVPLKLGSCKKVVATMDKTIVIGGSDNLVDVQERCEQLRTKIKLSTSDNILKDRLARLSGGFAVLKVFGKPDMREKKLRITNALHAAKAATEEGIVPGGGVALLYASKELDKLQTTNSGQKIGVQIVQNALKMPAYTIASSAGIGGSVVDKLLEQDNSELGYDPARSKYIDMFKCGVVDPLKLVRSEFANAASMISSKFEEYNLVHGG